MFNRFITKYGHTTTRDCKANWQRMTATGTPPTALSPLQHASSSAHPSMLPNGQSRHHQHQPMHHQLPWDVLQGGQKLDLAQKFGLAICWDNWLLQGILGQCICACQPDSCPGLATWIWYDHHGQWNIACILWQLACKFWHCILCCHAGDDGEPGQQPCCNAGPACKHSTVLHDRWPTAPKQHLCPPSAAMHVQQLPQRQWWQSRQRQRFSATINHEFWQSRWQSAAIDSSPHSWQALGDLELLPHPQQWCEQHSHQCNVWQTRASAQPKCKPCQHLGQINRLNAQNHLALSSWQRSIQRMMGIALF